MRPFAALCLLAALAGCGPDLGLHGEVGRYSLLGIYKPKGFSLVFDSATGDILTRALPPVLAAPEPTE